MVSGSAGFDGLYTETDVLVVGAGAGGLLAAMSAKRHGAPGTRVTLCDTWTIGRTGHTAFSNAWMIVAFPDDDIDGIVKEIVAGNDGIADQLLVREVLQGSHARMRDFEAIGMKFHRDGAGNYARRPTRGLDIARVMYPDGGGLEFWGASFVSDPFGTLMQRASHDREEVLIAECDLRRLEEVRRNWPFLRDRRIDAYGDLTRRLID